jgi:ribulose kinase
MLCLGIDSGPGSTKALVLDIESGEFIALAQRNYGTIEGWRRRCRTAADLFRRKRYREIRRGETPRRPPP